MKMSLRKAIFTISLLLLFQSIYSQIPDANRFYLIHFDYSYDEDIQKSILRNKKIIEVGSDFVHIKTANSYFIDSIDATFYTFLTELKQIDFRKINYTDPMSLFLFYQTLQEGTKNSYYVNTIRVDLYTTEQKERINNFIKKFDKVSFIQDEPTISFVTIFESFLASNPSNYLRNQMNQLKNNSVSNNSDSQTENVRLTDGPTISFTTFPIEEAAELSYDYIFYRNSEQESEKVCTMLLGKDTILTKINDEFVRFTFVKEIDNDNMITVYYKNEQLNSFIEIIEENNYVANVILRNRNSSRINSLTIRKK